MRYYANLDKRDYLSTFFRYLSVYTLTGNQIERYGSSVTLTFKCLSYILRRLHVVKKAQLLV